MRSLIGSPGFVLLRAIVLGIAALTGSLGMWLFQSAPAYADATCYQSAVGQLGCNYLKDHDSNLSRTTYWDEWAYRSSPLGATADHWYLRSNYYWGTEDSNRYALFDEEVHMLPDTLGGVTNYINGSSSGDSSVGGDNSTIQVRFWSTARACETCGGQDQRNYDGLVTRQRCENNPRQTESWNTSLGYSKDGGEIKIGWNTTWTPTVQCVSWPVIVHDPWSRYLNLTLGDDFYRDKEYYADLTDGQIMPNGYNGWSIHIGMSNLTRFSYGAFAYTIGSGNWFDDYTYGLGTRNCDKTPSDCPPAP